MQALWIVLIILFIAPGSYGESIREIRDENDNLFIRGTSCQELSAQAEALSTWAGKMQNAPSSVPSTCQCDVEGLCEINITHSIPDFVFQASLVKPDYYGPNCWNTTLVASGILPFQRFSIPEEITFWTHSSFCRELTLLEPLEVGDVIAIREKNESPLEDPFEIHAFIYITEELAFSKNGPETLSPISFQNPQEVFSFYGVTNKACQRVSGSSGACENFANVYRCESFQEHLSHHPAPTSAAYQEIESKLLEIESSVSDMTLHFRKKNISRASLHEKLQKNKTDLQSLQEKIVTLAKSLTMADSYEQEYWQGLSFRIQSTLEQIDYF